MLAAMHSSVVGPHATSGAHRQGQLADDPTAAVSVMTAFAGAVRHIWDADLDDIASYRQRLGHMHEQQAAAIGKEAREQTRRLRRAGMPLLIGMVAVGAERALSVEQRRRVITSLRQAVWRCMPQLLAEEGSQWGALLAAADAGDSAALLVGVGVPTGTGAGRVHQQGAHTIGMCISSTGDVDGKAQRSTHTQP